MLDLNTLTVKKTVTPKPRKNNFKKYRELLETK
jgi:hypothetical protein